MNLRYDRFQGLGLFKSDPNATLPESSICMNYDSIIGKMWDDSEVSDAEMDALIDQ